MKTLKCAVLMTLASASFAVAAQSYVVPPTSTTTNFVPVISDEKMEQCVKLYNETEWLSQEVKSIRVDQYSQESVDSYNSKVGQHGRMTRKFNIECAGKQSRSACEAAAKLNREQGLPHQPC